MDAGAPMMKPAMYELVSASSSGLRAPSSRASGTRRTNTTTRKLSEKMAATATAEE